MKKACSTVLGLAAIAALALTTTTTFAGVKPAKTKMDTPTITCVTSSGASITVEVCARSASGATGAPAGFSIQWMSCAAFDNGTDLDEDGFYTSPGENAPGQWPANSDLAPQLCKASLSGNAFGSRYNLTPGACADVKIGDTLLDNGASTTCNEPLDCGSCYVFRAFAHANNTLQRSDFTGTIWCSTVPCASGVDGCTLTQGYWKTHGPVPSGNNTDVWPTCAVVLGGTVYNVNNDPSNPDALALQTILDTSAQGQNAVIALEHQLIAAQLNLCNGALDDCGGTPISSVITAANIDLANGVTSSSALSGYIQTVSNYNEGACGPGHCQ
jgi:hypothetical protein